MYGKRCLSLLGSALLATLVLGPPGAPVLADSVKATVAGASQGAATMAAEQPSPCDKACRQGYGRGFSDGFADCVDGNSYRHDYNLGGASWDRGYVAGYGEGFGSCAG
ncbi:hypothetical protein [Streptosporangium roseum]|uniref:hypothetical protein n=1 Tax=Streptosporangium roseum TaxID=2001 RepID=UPI0033194336